jgi:hypothetical protein
MLIGRLVDECPFNKNVTFVAVQVWNDNAPLPDSLIGSAKLHLDASTILPPGADGKALVLELTQPGAKGGQAAPRGKLGVTAVVTAVAPTAAAKEDKGQPATSGKDAHDFCMCAKYGNPNRSCLILIARPDN